MKSELLYYDHIPTRKLKEINDKSMDYTAMNNPTIN